MNIYKNVENFTIDNINKFENNTDGTFKEFKKIFKCDNMKNHDDNSLVEIKDITFGQLRKVLVDNEEYFFVMHIKKIKNKNSKKTLLLINSLTGDEKLFYFWKDVASFFNMSIDVARKKKVINGYQVFKI